MSFTKKLNIWQSVTFVPSSGVFSSGLFCHGRRIETTPVLWTSVVSVGTQTLTLQHLKKYIYSQNWLPLNTIESEVMAAFTQSSHLFWQSYSRFAGKAVVLMQAQLKCVGGLKGILFTGGPVRLMSSYWLEEADKWGLGLQYKKYCNVICLHSQYLFPNHELLENMQKSKIKLNP